jgi:rare lipoprotein A
MNTGSSKLNLAYWKFQLLLAVAIFFLAGCDSSPESATPVAVAEPVLESKTGLASFYGPGLEGQKTASGEIFDSDEMVAAHRRYPMGTIVRVTNLENGDTVRVRVSDRGPTKENRDEGVIIDLSKGAAKKIRMLSDGRVQVKLEVLKWGNDTLP